jgi:hypothetical protein
LVLAADRFARCSRLDEAVTQAAGTMTAVEHCQLIEMLQSRDTDMTLTTILIIILILILIGAFPAWPYSRGWGYGPSGILGIIVIVLLILLLTGRM